MVQDYYLNHLQGGRRYVSSPLLHHSNSSCFFEMPNNDDLFSDDDWNDFLPTKADEYDHGLSSFLGGAGEEEESSSSEMLPQSKDPLINKSVESMDADWESLISEAVKDSENKSLDLLEMALQESKATELEEDPSHFPIEPVQFTFDPLSFALSQEPLGSGGSVSSSLPPAIPDPPPKKKKMSTAEILQATLDKNRTALAMKNASHMLRGSSQQLNRNINHNNVNHSRLARGPFSIKNSQFVKPMRNVVIPPPSPSYLTGAAPKTSVIKVSKGNVILQIPSSISSASQKTSNPRSLLMPKKPVSALSQPRMVKILDPKTKTFKLIKLSSS